MLIVPVSLYSYEEINMQIIKLGSLVTHEKNKSVVI
jgi:hypothetical protein